MVEALVPTHSAENEKEEHTEEADHHIIVQRVRPPGLRFHNGCSPLIHPKL